MLVARRREFEALSMSALDLFATALGVFVLIAIFLFPYYLNEPSTKSELEGSEAELAAAGGRLDKAREQARVVALARSAAEARRDAAAEALTRAKAALADDDDRIESVTASARAAAERADSIRNELARLHIADLDLVFVMDLTGSMGDELNDMRSSLGAIIRTARRLAPTLNAGFVAFKDFDDDYLTRAYSLAHMEGRNIGDLLSFVERLKASGGGDVPEPVDIALKAAMEMPWRDDVRGRIVVIGDAPAHAANEGRVLQMAADFAKSGSALGGRRISAIFTGDNPRAQSFYRRLAAAGGGDFTDHRGRMIESVLLSILDPLDRSGR